MYQQVEKTKNNESRALANSVTQKKSNMKQGFGFVDNRPETVAQRKMQEMANNYSVRQHQIIQKKKLNTRLPDNLKSGVECGYQVSQLYPMWPDTTNLLGANYTRNITNGGVFYNAPDKRSHISMHEPALDNMVPMEGWEGDYTTKVFKTSKKGRALDWKSGTAINEPHEARNTYPMGSESDAETYNDVAKKLGKEFWSKYSKSWLD